MTTTIETREFQAEARQLLDLMIHSVYSNKDIFLRELISNASDALDKRRVASLTNERISMPREPEIRVERNPAGRLLTISDNGIGMSRQEVIEYVGTLARSGTKEFLNRLKSNAAGGSGASGSDAAAPGGAPNIGADLIGQFGVGFYSCFLVANRVALTTRRADEETATRWESTGDGTYTLEEVERMEPGTSVTLYLKDADPDNGIEDYTGEWKIKEIIKQYSDFVTYPIRMEIGDKPTTINSMKAIWTRDPGDVKPEEYTEFYHHLSHDWADPLDTFRFKGEGTFEYTMLLFLPERAPFDLFYPEMKRGVHLYVKRVFIMDDCKDLVPDHLRFVRGVVDSEDLSLNISREILQQDRQITLMRKRLERKVLQELEEMKTRWVKHRDVAERSEGDADAQTRSTSESESEANSELNTKPESMSDSESMSTFDADSRSATDIDTKDSAPDDMRASAYLTFWRSFGKVLKEGLYRPSEHTERILALCLFASTTPASAALNASDGSSDADSDGADSVTGGVSQAERAAVVTLADYVSRMKEDQEPVYYLAGEHLSVLRESPHLEAFRAKGYEVLLLTDPVDELWTATPNLEYQGHRFESIAKGTAEIGSTEERRRAANELSSKRKELDSLLDSIQEHLSSKVKSVRLTNRLTESLACLVGDEGDLSPHMAQMLRAMGQDPGEPKRVLELNPNHPVLAKLRQVFDADAKDPRIAEYAELIHGQAVLSEGGRLADPARFTKLLGKLMAGGFGA